MEVKRFHTIWESLMISKALGISFHIYSASNINVPKGVLVISNVKGRLFRFIWKNKRDKIRRQGVYQDYGKGEHGLQNSLRVRVPMLYVFQCCTCSNVVRVLIPFNNKEILIHGKPFFWKEWFKKGIRTIKDLLDKNENVLPAWCKEMESNRSYGP